MNSFNPRYLEGVVVKNAHRGPRGSVGRSCETFRTLDEDAREVAASLVKLLPGSLHSLGIAAVRELFNSPPDTVRADASVDRRQIDVGDHSIPLWIYRSTATQPLPVLLYIHGGGWSIGTLEGVDRLCRELRDRVGCHVVSVGYRLAPEHPFPAALTDCLAALDWIHANAHDLNADRSRIAIGGDSAGGNLSIACCLAARDTGRPMPVFQMLAYPATDFTSTRSSWSEYADAPLLTAHDARWFMSLYAPDAADHSNPLASPMAADSLAGMPPTHVITAEVDVLRDDGEAFVERLRAAGVQATSKRYPGVFHGFFTELGVFRRTDEAIEDASRALRDALLPTTPAGGYAWDSKGY